MTEKTDILVIGATGYTGAYIVRYLVAHPQRSRFTLALGARSTEKLQKLVDDLKLTKDVKLVKLDVTKQDEVDAAVAATRVVISAVGPYWTWGTPVVRYVVAYGVYSIGAHHFLNPTARVLSTVFIMLTSQEREAG